MRRKDREITDREKILKILEEFKCCRIGINDGGKVYIVPVNFGFVWDNNNIFLYFHGANAGRKYDLISRSPQVGFEMDTFKELVISDKACGYTAKYSSIVGEGKAEIVKTYDEKIAGLTAIMKQNTGKNNWEFDEKSVSGVCVFKITVEDMTCKSNE